MSTASERARACARQLPDAGVYLEALECGEAWATDHMWTITNGRFDPRPIPPETCCPIGAALLATGVPYFAKWRFPVVGTLTAPTIADALGGTVEGWVAIVEAVDREADPTAADA